jgi:hypothetical protein
MRRNTNVKAHDFAMVPQNNGPRSQFKSRCRHLTKFDAGLLVPHFVAEVYPGDSWHLKHTLFARVATPIYPIMDNLYMDTFYYFVPLRLLWQNFKKMMGEQANPSDSISYITPQQVSDVGGYAVGSLQDYMGLPTVGQVTAGNTKSHSAFWTRAYNFIWNNCFRDENMQNSVTFDTGDGPDASPSANYKLMRRGKRFDYFTSALPWPQKGATGVSVPLAGSAPVISDGTSPTLHISGDAANKWSTLHVNGGAAIDISIPVGAGGGTSLSGGVLYVNSGLTANLSAASGVLINQLRQSIMIQEFLELDARGGTRYVEFLKMHFGVISPDFRQQHPEYLGGGSTMININPVTQ